MTCKFAFFFFFFNTVESVVIIDSYCKHMQYYKGRCFLQLAFEYLSYVISCCRISPQFNYELDIWCLNGFSKHFLRVKFHFCTYLLDNRILLCQERKYKALQFKCDLNLLLRQRFCQAKIFQLSFVGKAQGWQTLKTFVVEKKPLGCQMCLCS